MRIRAIEDLFGESVQLLFALSASEIPLHIDVCLTSRQGSHSTRITLHKDHTPQFSPLSLLLQMSMQIELQFVEVLSILHFVQSNS
jgi:hypothetical protein